MAYGANIQNKGANLNFVDASGKTVQVGKSRRYIEEAVKAGLKPSNSIEWNESNKYMMKEGGNMNTLISPQSMGIDTRSEIQKAKDAASEIMSDYREFGADNPYLKQYESELGNVLDKSKTVGPTDYASALLDQSSAMKQRQLDEEAQGSARDLASAYSNLAMTGGLNTGARENLMNQANRGNIYSRQKTFSDYATKDLGTLAEDAKYKQNLYSQYLQGIGGLGQQREAYGQEREKQRFATAGNIYSREGQK